MGNRLSAVKLMRGYAFPGPIWVTAQHVPLRAK
jgi:hypothetical protein